MQQQKDHNKQKISYKKNDWKNVVIKVKENDLPNRIFVLFLMSLFAVMICMLYDSLPRASFNVLQQQVILCHIQILSMVLNKHPSDWTKLNVSSFAAIFEP